MSAALARKLPAFEPLYVSAERIILLRGHNLNLADTYLAIYGCFPPAGAPVRFVLVGNIASCSPSIPALRTGRWPAGVVPYLDLNGHCIGGADGAGG